MVRRSLRWMPLRWLNCGLCLLYTSALLITSGRKNRRRGAEHGSAKWGDVFQIAKRYRDKKNPKQNLILTQHFQMGMDGHKHKRNTNVLVIGGSGAGKSRSYAIPNALNCGNCSLVICDPKSEILRKTGGALKANGYEVRAVSYTHLKFFAARPDSLRATSVPSRVKRTIWSAGSLP